MKTIQRIFAIGCFMLSTSSAWAQSDFGIWTSIDASTKLNKKLELSFEGEYRTQDNSSMTERVSGAVHLSYKNKAIPFLKADVGYSYMYMNYPADTEIKYEKDANGMSTDVPSHKNVDEAYWTARHRATASLTGSFKWNRFKFSLRERYQFTYRMPAECQRERYGYHKFFEAWDDIPETMTDHKPAKSDHKLRTRLQVSYDIRKCPFEPYAEVELYNQLDNALAYDKIRYTVGTEYKINKDNKLKIFYRFQDYADIDEVSGHILGLGYSFEF